MQILEGVPPGRGRQTTLGVVDDGNFWRFRWLRLQKLQRYGKQYYMTICCPLSAGNWLQNEWSWVAISRQNPYSASTTWIRAFECQKIIQPLRFRGVLCIARSVSQPRYRHAQLTRCFSAVAELLVSTRKLAEVCLFFVHLKACLYWWQVSIKFIKQKDNLSPKL